MKTLLILACVFAGVAGFSYGFLSWLGEPCKSVVWTDAVLTVTSNDGKTISQSPINIRTCAP